MKLLLSVHRTNFRNKGHNKICLYDHYCRNLDDIFWEIIFAFLCFIFHVEYMHRHLMLHFSCGVHAPSFIVSFFMWSTCAVI